MEKIAEVGDSLGVRATCEALSVTPSTYYRSRRPKPPPKPRSCPRALSSLERQEVLDTLHGPRFVDAAPAQVVATLLAPVEVALDAESDLRCLMSLGASRGMTQSPIAYSAGTMPSSSRTSLLSDSAPTARTTASAGILKISCCQPTTTPLGVISKAAV